MTKIIIVLNILLASAVLAQDLTREQAVLQCQVAQETIRFDYFRPNINSSVSMIVARGLDNEGNTIGNCEYSETSESTTSTLFFPKFVSPEGQYVCPGRQLTKYKIGKISVDSILLKTDTSAGTPGQIIIELIPRQVSEGSKASLVISDCVRL